MCSIGEGDFGDEGGAHMMVKEKSIESETLMGACKKCSLNEAVIKLNFREAECKDCFLEYVRHKFRATLGSSKILPKEADVLVVFDGSAESVVLLDMVYFAITQNSFKRLRCNAKVLYIDHNFLRDSQDEKILPLIKQILSRYNTKSYLMSISSDKNPISFDNIGNEDLFTTEGGIFREHFDSIKTLTARQDFLSKVQYTKIKSAAEYLECKYVFLPDITPNLATTLLNDIILGRGGSTALDVSLIDDRIPNLKLIRPIKDLSDKEVRSYIELNDLKFIETCSFGEKNGSHASLQNLTKSFVENLNNNFPSTVSTVFRTGGKLTPKFTNSVNADLPKCSFCYSTLDYFGAKTLFAIEFSRLVSHNASKSLSDLESLEKIAKEELEQSESSVLGNLCHGCRNIYYDCPDCFQSQ